jgi:outer membrane lipoprotein-sorting protein
MRKNMIAFSIFIVFTLIFSHLNVCYSDEINLEELKNIVKKRIDGCNPIWVKYQINTTHTSDYYKRLYKSQDISNDTNLTLNVIMEWAQKGDKLRFSCTAPGTFKGKIVSQPQESLFVFDGKLVINNDSNFYLNNPDHPLYSISSDKTNAKVFFNLPDESGDSALYNILSAFNPQNQRYELKKQTNSDDSNIELIHLSIENLDNTKKLLAWLTDDQYYTIHKLEFTSGRGRYIFDKVNYKMVNGCPILNSCKVTSFFDDKFDEEKIINVSFVENRGNKIPDSLFTMKIPQNAVVKNMDTGKVLVDTSVIKDYLDSIPLWKHPKFWFLGCLNFILISLIIYLKRHNIKSLIKLLFNKL